MCVCVCVMSHSVDEGGRERERHSKTLELHIKFRGFCSPSKCLLVVCYVSPPSPAENKQAGGEEERSEKHDEDDILFTAIRDLETPTPRRFPLKLHIPAVNYLLSEEEKSSRVQCS